MRKPIPEFPGYEITDDGRVWGKRFRRPMKLVSGQQGYLQVNLYRNGRAHLGRVHRLVLQTFLGPCPAGMEACHKNGVNTDNRLSNLYWGTHQENMSDAVGQQRMGRLKGSQHPMAVLSEADALHIRTQYHAGGLTMRQLGDMHGVSRFAVSDLLRGKSWKHLSEIAA